MDDYSLVPVEHQPDFENVSLVPVDHNPFSADGVTQQPQSQQAQTEPAQSGPQPAAGVERLYVGRPANNTQAPEVGESWNPDTEISGVSRPNVSAASTPAQDEPAYDWSHFNQQFGELKPATFTPTQQLGYPAADALTAGSTPDVVTPQQMLRGAINQFYPGAEFSGLAQQAYKNGQYGNAIGYGVGAVADSLLALAGGKLFGASTAALKGIAGSSWALRRALERTGQVFQKGYATHHIVAKLASEADPARIILRRLGIDIHDATNGVFLRDIEHQHLHNKQYYEAVNKALAGATSKAEAEQILRSIGQRLKSGTFP